MRQGMDRRDLKVRVESGDYKPEPGLVAQAMLSHRGVRELLTGDRPSSEGRPVGDGQLPGDRAPSAGGLPLRPTGRTQSAEQAPRQAA